MNFKEIDYSGPQQTFLDDTEEMGCVTDVVIFELLPGDNRYDVHQNAAISGMKVFSDRYRTYFQKLNPSLNILDYFHIKIFPEIAPSGRPISFREFLGEAYVPGKDTIALWEDGPDYKGRSCSFPSEGFIHALLNPPYGIRIEELKEKKWGPEYTAIERKAHYQLLADFCRNIFSMGDLEDNNHLVIYKWSDDWSNYFDAGKEYWGTFFWTIENKKHNQIVVIGASTTD